MPQTPIIGIEKGPHKTFLFPHSDMSNYYNEYGQLNKLADKTSN